MLYNSGYNLDSEIIQSINQSIIQSINQPEQGLCRVFVDYDPDDADDARETAGEGQGHPRRSEGTDEEDAGGHRWGDPEGRTGTQ